MLNKNLLNNPFVFSIEKLSSNNLMDNYIQLDYGFFYYNTDTKIFVKESNDTIVICIGYMLDIRDSQKNKEQLLEELIELYINEDEESFYEHLNFINGRYVLIFSNRYDTRIYTDATSMSPVFYYKTKLISSHEIILKELINDEYDIQLSANEYEMKNFLDYSNTDQIYSFNPNLFYSGERQNFERYFPRRRFQEQSLNQVVDNTEGYLDQQLAWLKNNYNNIYLSLTGGFDSKLSLAIVKPIINDIKTFTYMFRFSAKDEYEKLNQFRKIYYKDKYIVENLISNFNLNHEYFYFEDYDVPSKFIEDIGYHVSSHHSYQLSYLSKKEFPSNSVHLKSTLYEFSKLPYQEFADMNTNDNQMIRAIKHWAPKEIRDNEELLYNMYLEYIERNLIDDIVEYGYNLPMMLYWEFRMGNWHSSLTQETDFVIDTFVFINCRYLINQLISLSKQDRKEKGYLTAIVKRNWPALNYFVANSFDTLEDKLEEID